MRLQKYSDVFLAKWAGGAGPRDYIDHSNVYLSTSVILTEKQQ